MINQPAGPTLLGFDVILVGTILAGLAAFAVLFAIYTAVTIKDPMAKRVKSLNERRDELKAGIVTSNAKKRVSLIRKTEGTDKMKPQLEGMKVLQQSQIEDLRTRGVDRCEGLAPQRGHLGLRATQIVADPLPEYRFWDMALLKRRAVPVMGGDVVLH